MNQTATEGKGRSKWRRWLVAILGLLLAVSLATGLLIAKLSAGQRRARAEIEKRLEAIRAAGQPVTAQDLAKLYPDPPPEKDASLLLEPALELMSIPDETTNLLFFDKNLPRSAPLHPSVLAEGQKWLHQNQAAFALIPWSKLEHAWVGSGFTNGFFHLTEAPSLKMRHLVRLLCLGAVLQAEEQHPHEAMEFLQRAAVVGNTFKNDVTIHFLSKAIAETDISVALERVVNRANPTDADLASLPRHLTPTNIGATKETELINQRAEVLFLADLFKPDTTQLTKGVLSSGPGPTRNFPSAFIYHDEDLLEYLDWRDHCVAALDSPVSNAIPTLREMEKLQDEAEKKKHFFRDFLTGDRLSFQTMVKPHVKGTFLADLKTVAHVRLAVAALAVERWRLAHGGQVPGSLAELTPGFLPAIPADPFDGQSLRYKKLAKGYVIYSIGEDLTDDGGKEQPADAIGSEGYDITFTVDK